MKNSGLLIVSLAAALSFGCIAPEAGLTEAGFTMSEGGELGFNWHNTRDINPSWGKLTIEYQEDGKTIKSKTYNLNFGGSQTSQALIAAQLEASKEQQESLQESLRTSQELLKTLQKLMP